MRATLHTDGACLGNPGKMGLGIVLQTEQEIHKQSIPFGIGTNNIAEYSALIKGLEFAIQNNVTHIEAFADSQLMVNQVNGDWKVKHENVIPLHNQVQKLKQQFESFEITWIRREQNGQADNLSKQAADQV